MTDYEIPKPEPKEIDEKNWLEFKHMAERAVLKGEPYGAEKCENCMYYLNPARVDLVLLAPAAPDPRGCRVVVPVVGEDRGRVTGAAVSGLLGMGTSVTIALIRGARDD